MTLRLIIHGLTSPTTHSSRQLQNLSPIPVGSFVYMFKLAAALNSNCYASDTVAATRWIMATTSKLRRRRGRRNDDELNPFSMMPPKGQKRLEQCVDCHLRKTSTRQRITFENTVACKRNDLTSEKPIHLTCLRLLDRNVLTSSSTHRLLCPFQDGRETVSASPAAVASNGPIRFQDHHQLARWTFRMCFWNVQPPRLSNRVLT
jgi:hypothetical protein